MPYALAAGRGFSAAYMRMLLDPFDSSKSIRYPDATTKGTCLAHFLSRITSSVTADMELFGAAMACGSDMSQTTSPVTYPADALVPASASTVAANPTAVNFYYTGSAGVYTPLADLNPTGTNGTGWNSGSPPGTLGFNYGTRQTTYEAASSLERTLACGVRLRCTGLPPGQFAYNGRAYFMWIAAADFPRTNVAGAVSGYYVSSAATIAAFGGAATQLNEARCIAAVEAGQGFTLSLADVDRSGGVMIPSLPAGPNSFLYRATGSSRISGAWSYGYATNAANGPVAFAQQGSSTPFEPGQFLVIALFGVAQGTVLTLETAHVIEYVPSPSSGAIAVPEVSYAPTAVRDEILASSARLNAEVAGESDPSALEKLTGLARRAGRALRASVEVAGAMAGGYVGGGVRPASLAFGGAGAPPSLTDL